MKLVRELSLAWQAFKERDPSCLSYSSALLYPKVIDVFESSFEFDSTGLPPLLQL